MSRFFRHLSGSLRRRVLIVTAIVMAVILAVTVAIVSRSTDRLTSRRNAMVLQLSDQSIGRNAVLGTGINLTGLPDNNLISNGSFSPQLFQAHYAVHSGTANAFDIKVSETRTDISLTENHFVGASIAIYRETLSSMDELHDAVITNYEAGRIMDKTPVLIPEELAGIALTGFAEWEGHTYACGPHSTLLKIPSGGDATAMSFDFLSDLTAIAAGPDGLMTGDASGRLFSSRDGVFWQLLPLEMSTAVKAIAYVPIPNEANGFFLASGGPGELMFGRLQDMSPLATPIKDDAVTAFVVTEDDIIYALGDQGHVYFSMNGVEWTEETELASENAWLAGDVSGNLAFFTGAAGQMAIRRANGLFEFLGAEGPDSLPRALRRITPYDPDADIPLRKRTLPNLSGVLSVTSEKIVVLTESGDTLFSKDQGETWQPYALFSDQPISRMSLMPSGDIYLVHPGGALSRTELTSRFTFEPALPVGEVQADDLIALSLATGYRMDVENQDLAAREGDLRAGEWSISGGAEVASSEDADVGRTGYDSVGSLEITFKEYTAPTEENERGSQDGDGTVATEKRDASSAFMRHERLFSIARQTVFQAPVNNPNRSYLSARLSQRIDLSRLVVGNVLPLFRLEFDVSRSDDADGELEVWFSGPLVNEGKVFTVPAGGWRHQRETFAFTKKLHPEDELWINFGFTGSGSYKLDNVWFGRSEDARGALSSLVAENETLPLADVLRFDCVPIGRAGYLSESWCLPEGSTSGIREKRFHNLGCVMQLADLLGAQPWLVVDMHATEVELAHLMEYIAGSPLTPYGRLRSRDGAIGKWSDRFDVMYIEIVDRENVLQNDVTRSNKVRWVIDRLSSSPEFHAIRNRVFFIDGMRYEDGRSHTSTDYHAGDFINRTPFANTEEYNVVLEEWVNAMPRWRTGDHHIYSELMRSFDVNGWETASRLADAIGVMLGDLGDHTALSMMNVDFSLPEALSGQAMNVRALEVTGGLFGMERLATPTVIRKSGSVSEEGLTVEETTIYEVFRSREEVTVIVANLGKSTSVISIEGLDVETDVFFDLYDYRGYPISSGMRSSYREAFTLLPGGVVVIRQHLD